MNSDAMYDRVLDYLELSLEGQEIENFKPAYDGAKALGNFYLFAVGSQQGFEMFVLDAVVRIYEDDCDEEGGCLSPICPPFKLAKLIYVDEDLKSVVEHFLDTGSFDCGCPIAPNKLQFLKSSLSYAKNFHPNYLPEYLLER
jgi:hypothetical protein